MLLPEEHVSIPYRLATNKAREELENKLKQ